MTEAFVSRQVQLVPVLECLGEGEEGQPQDIQPGSTEDGSQVARRSQTTGSSANWIVDGDKQYARETHPALFKVIDLLEQDAQARNLSVRQLAQQTCVSKSWCAIAKRYVLGSFLR